MAKQMVTCQMCGETLAAESEDELVKMLHKHLTEKHDLGLTAQDARQMVQEK